MSLRSRRSQGCNPKAPLRCHALKGKKSPDMVVKENIKTRDAARTCRALPAAPGNAAGPGRHQGYRSSSTETAQPQMPLRNSKAWDFFFFQAESSCAPGCSSLENAVSSTEPLQGCPHPRGCTPACHSAAAPLPKPLKNVTNYTSNSTLNSTMFNKPFRLRLLSR